MTTTSTPAKAFLSWEQVEGACLTLAERLPDHITGILPVGRGGCVPASIIAYKLKLPIIGLALPTDDTNWTTASNRRDIALIDDVCDTGRTFRGLRVRFYYAVFAAPYVKPRGKPQCDYWCAEVPQDRWLCFPWARDDVINR